MILLLFRFSAFPLLAFCWCWLLAAAVRLVSKYKVEAEEQGAATSWKEI